MITEGETTRAFVRELGPRGLALHDCLSIIPVNTVEEMATRVNSYINLEIAEEGWKAHKEASKKEGQEGKKSKQHPPKFGHDDKRRLFVPRPQREIFENFTPLNRDILVILNEMERKDLAGGDGCHREV